MFSCRVIWNWELFRHFVRFFKIIYNIIFVKLFFIKDSIVF
nr:MAG TPA_asm: hypothetical protein [Bacteriophage sp.]